MVFGIVFFDLALVTGVFILLMLVIGILNTYIPIAGSRVFLVLFIVYTGLLVLLRFANRQGEKDYILSFLSYHFFQPKHIKYYGGKRS